jgi:hypothetical protein
MNQSVKERSLLAANLWAVENFAENRAATFLAKGPGPVATWLNELLLYDKSIIPIQDYLVPTILVTQLGQENVIDLLESDVLSFARLLGGVAYHAPKTAGSHDGGFLSFVHPCHLRGRTERTPLSTTHLLKLTERTLRQALNGPIDSRLIRLLRDKTTEIDASSFIVEIGDRILDELRTDGSMRDWAGVRLQGNELKLPGEPGAVTVYSGALSDGVRSEGERLASLLGASTELWVAASSNCHDVSTTGPIQQVLARRSLRHLCSEDRSRSFVTIREICDLPDPGLMAFSDPHKCRRFLRLRRSPAGLAFRRWFHKDAATCNQVEIARALVSLLSEGDLVTSAPVRTMRFIATSAISSVPVVGTAVSAFDTFIVERIFRDRSAMLFLDRLRRAARR